MAQTRGKTSPKSTDGSYAPGGQSAEIDPRAAAGVIRDGDPAASDQDHAARVRADIYRALTEDAADSRLALAERIADAAVPRSPWSPYNQEYAYIDRLTKLAHSDGTSYREAAAQVVPVMNSYAGWKALGWQVKKGEKGSSILIPRMVQKKDADGAPVFGADEKPVKTLAGFMSRNVAFTADQIEPAEGETPEKFWVKPQTSDPERTRQAFDSLKAVAEEQGITVTVEDTGSAGGSISAPTGDDSERRIRLSVMRNQQQHVRVLAHELGHHFDPGLQTPEHMKRYSNDRDYRARCELVAEATAAAICGELGIEQGRDHDAYYASWAPEVEGDTGDDMIPVSAEGKPEDEWMTDVSTRAAVSIGELVEPLGLGIGAKMKEAKQAGADADAAMRKARKPRKGKGKRRKAA